MGRGRNEEGRNDLYGRRNSCIASHRKWVGLPHEGLGFIWEVKAKCELWIGHTSVGWTTVLCV